MRSANGKINSFNGLVTDNIRSSGTRYTVAKGDRGSSSDQKRKVEV